MGFIRSNSVIANAVERGLAVALLLDVRAGAKAMSGAGVPISVALRVLLHPAQRRTNDWVHE
ncbi:MAG: hypothetical protein IV101_04980 [Dechloromonas sp.]|uniref:hypothetical protein n=1 Tax=Ferribacterium limneticum TaxID=76259 RepID=UPI001CF8681F|nr:hypothetical protein [Ferribacterium limneticum]MBT9520228.1 hypothetical protein [Dechloromonas sp.]UCV21575.1 hypothetical protein KI613_13620 [Ferribacterium limneticum]